MFRQIAPHGIVNKSIHVPIPGVDLASHIPGDDEGEAVPGDAIAVAAGDDDTVATHEEMSNITAAQCPFLMNKE
jgi:hypothetical protein